METDVRAQTRKLIASVAAADRAQLEFRLVDSGWTRQKAEEAVAAREVTQRIVLGIAGVCPLDIDKLAMELRAATTDEEEKSVGTEIFRTIREEATKRSAATRPANTTPVEERMGMLSR